MATYNNQHWLLSHIRNSFISTDDTGLCETVMVSDDLPKHFLLLQRLQLQKKIKLEKPSGILKLPSVTISNNHKMYNINEEDYEQQQQHQQHHIQHPRHHQFSSSSSLHQYQHNNNLLLSVPHIPKHSSHQHQQQHQHQIRTYTDDDFLCYPGLDQSDDEDLDLASQSFDIPMYPEIGSHRYRSNTAQKLEKMEIARRKAARIKNIKVDNNSILTNQDTEELNRLFVKREMNNFVNHQSSSTSSASTAIFESIPTNHCDIQKQNNVNHCNRHREQQQQQQQHNQNHIIPEVIQNKSLVVKKLDYGQSKLVEQLLSCPKKPQNRFIQYARFDGTSQSGVPTKNLNIFISMLPENQRNYPLKICVTAAAKIHEVIGFICYKCNILNPELQLQSVRHYGLYISEDNGEMDLDFPPLDLREPCSKFGFTCLTLAELRPNAHVTRVDYRSLSMTSEIEAAGEAAIADIQAINNNNQSDDMAKMLGHNSMIEAPLYRSFRVLMIIKSFFKTEVQLGISGERLEIDPVQQKNSKFWSKQKAVSYNMESIAYCEIIEQKSNKTILRIWYLSIQPTLVTVNSLTSGNSGISNLYPDSPYVHKSHQYHHTTHSHHHHHLNNSELKNSSSPQHSLVTTHNFKHYDFETDTTTAQQIVNKINCILEVKSSVTRREFLVAKEKKKEKKDSTSSSTSSSLKKNYFK